MNIGKSIKVACALNDTLQKDVAVKVGVTPEHISVIVRKNTCTGKMLSDLSNAFDMQVSEFIALGEG